MQQGSENPGITKRNVDQNILDLRQTIRINPISNLIYPILYFSL